MTAGAGLKDGRDAWVARVFEWLKAAFPNEGHKLVNVAVPGTTSCYLAPCALQVPSLTIYTLLAFHLLIHKRNRPSTCWCCYMCSFHALSLPLCCMTVLQRNPGMQPAITIHALLL